jgi:hypothetical protein
MLASRQSGPSNQANEPIKRPSAPRAAAIEIGARIVA